MLLPEKHALSPLPAFGAVDGRIGMTFGVPGAEHKMQAALETLALEHGKVGAMRLGLMATRLVWHNLV